MTNEELTEKLKVAVDNLNRMYKGRDKLRLGLAALETQTLKEQYPEPRQRHKQALDMRQHARDNYGDAVTRAELLAEQVAGMTPERARRAYLASARLVPELTDAQLAEQLGAYATSSEKRLTRQNAAILGELRLMNLREALRGADAGELAARAKNAVAAGTETGAAELELIRREAATRSNLAEHRVIIQQCLDAVALPAATAEQTETAAKILAVVNATKRAYREIETGTEDLTDKLERISADPAGFQAGVRERDVAQRKAVQQTADRMKRAAVLAALDDSPTTSDQGVSNGN